MVLVIIPTLYWRFITTLNELLFLSPYDKLPSYYSREWIALENNTFLGCVVFLALFYLWFRRLALFRVGLAKNVLFIYFWFLLYSFFYGFYQSQKSPLISANMPSVVSRRYPDCPEAQARRVVEEVEEERGRYSRALTPTSCWKLGSLEAMWCKAFAHHILPWLRPSYFVIHCMLNILQPYSFYNGYQASWSLTDQSVFNSRVVQVRLRNIRLPQSSVLSSSDSRR